jgi:hypothetical protein
MTTNDDDAVVGYRRPPRHSQFQKGRSGNPHGRPRKRPAPGAVDLAAILDSPVSVTRGGRTVVMDQKEVELRQVLKKGLAGDLRSIAYLFEEFEKYGALPAAKQRGGVITLPTNDMPGDMAEWLLYNIGLPPWSPRDITRGRAHYLKHRSDRDRREDEALHYPALENPDYRMAAPEAGDKAPRPKGPRSIKAIVQDFAQERHKVTIDGEMRDATAVELLLQILNRKRLAGEVRAAKLFYKICRPFLDSGDEKGGWLVLPETAKPDMYLKMLELDNQHRVDPRPSIIGPRQ